MTATVIPFPVERRTQVVATTTTDWAEQAHAVLDAAERLVDDEPAEVLALCQRGFELLTVAGPEIDDDVSLHLLAGRLGALYRQAGGATGRGAVDVSVWLTEGWRRCPTVTRHFVSGTHHPAGLGRPISAAVAAARRRHPTAGRPRRIG